jgi:copper chaperone
VRQLVVINACSNPMTYHLQVPTIACVGCISAISLAIATLDPKAKIEGDPATKIISLESSLSEPKIREAITRLGHKVEDMP